MKSFTSDLVYITFLRVWTVWVRGMGDSKVTLNEHRVFEVIGHTTSVYDDNVDLVLTKTIFFFLIFNRVLNFYLFIFFLMLLDIVYIFNKTFHLLRNQNEGYVC